MKPEELELALKRVKKFVLREGKGALATWRENAAKHACFDKADVTTDTDRSIEQSFHEFIDECYPNHSVVGEELGAKGTKDSEFTWYIDPIDGTKYFACGVPLWTISIALFRKEVPVLGVIYDPVSDQLYFAAKGQGAYLGGRRLESPKASDPRKMQISFDIESVKSAEDPEMLRNLDSEFYRVRIIGSASLSLVWLVQGLFGAYIMPHLETQKQFVDISAGLAIAKEAGFEIFLRDRNSERVLIVSTKPVVKLIRKIVKV